MEASYILSEALSLFSSNKFISSLNEINDEKIVCISFKITENLSEQLNATSFSHHFSDKSSVIISFESIIDEHEAKIFWKNCEREKFKTLRIAEDYDGTVIKYCKRFLLETFKNQEASKYIYNMGSFGYY